MSRKKLSTWAEEQAVHYRTALAWVNAGAMPAPIERTPGGHIRVLDAPTPATNTQRIVLYTRVSSSDQKADLDRQADRLRAFAAGRGFAGVEVVKDIGSQKLDIKQDFVDVVTSMCARIYGRRAARSRATRAIAAAEDPS